MPNEFLPKAVFMEPEMTEDAVKHPRDHTNLDLWQHVTSSQLAGSDFTTDDFAGTNDDT